MIATSRLTGWPVREIAVNSLSFRRLVGGAVVPTVRDTKIGGHVRSAYGTT